MSFRIILLSLLFQSLTWGQWVSNPNEISELTTEDQKKLLGAEPPEKTEYSIFNNNEDLSDLPQFLDWRNYKGQDFMSPVRAQGRCGSCVVFAAVGAFEAQLNIANDWADLDIDLSEQDVLSCGGGSCSGWLPGFGLQWLQSKGAVVESLYPYLSGTIAEDLVCKEFPKESRMRLKGHEYVGPISNMDYEHGIFEVIPLTKRRVIEALQKGPLTTSMTVWKDLLSYSSGIYKHSWGERLGGHAIVIAGYSLEENYWIVRNSWGAEWGEAGYFRIAMDDEDSGLGQYNSAVSVAPFDRGTVAIIGREERQAISQEDKIKIETSYKYVLKTNLLIKQNDKLIKKIWAHRENFFAAFVDTSTRDQFWAKTKWSKLEDGVYQIQAETFFFDKGFKKELSHPIDIIVVNGKPQISISIAGFSQDDEPLDICTDIEGRIYVEMDLSFSKVPPERIELLITHESGKKIIVKNKKPAEKIFLGWRTSLSQNGRYTIYGQAVVGNHLFKSQTFEIVVNNPEERI